MVDNGGGAIVNGGLLAINLLSSPGHWWFYWPMLGWGIGLAAHDFAQAVCAPEVVLPEAAPRASAAQAEPPPPAPGKRPQSPDGAGTRSGS